MIRCAVTEHVALLASAEEQIAYERNVPHVPVPSEIIEMFVTDLYHPKDPDYIESFSEAELKDMARLYGLLCDASEIISGTGIHSVTDLLKTPEWRRVMKYSKDLLVNLR